MADNDKETAKSARKVHPSTSTDAPTTISGNGKADMPIIIPNENLPVIAHDASSSLKGPSGARPKEDKDKFDSSKCVCCEKPLYSGANCLPKVPLALGAIPHIISGIDIKKLGKPSQVNYSIGSISMLGNLGQVKYNRCTSCNGYVCRHCKGECHECIVRKQLVLEPEAMLQIDRYKLLGLLQILHYPNHHFDKWEKPFLVKQICTRFNIHQDWKPRPSSVMSTESVDKSQQNLDHAGSQKQKADVTGSQKQKADVTGSQKQKADVTGSQKQKADVAGSQKQKYDVAGSTLQRKRIDNSTVKTPSETKQEKSKSFKSHASSKTIFYDKQNISEPEASKVKDQNSSHKSIKKTKSNHEETYKDMKQAIDNLPEGILPILQQESERPVKDEQKSRKTSNISSTSSTPQKTKKPETHQKEPVDKSQAYKHGKQATELPTLKSDSPKLKKAEFTKSKDSMSNSSTPTRPRKVDQLKMLDRLDYSLKDITALKDIDELSYKQVKHILSRHSFDMKTIANEEDMRYALKRLWHFRKEKENEALVSGSMDDLRKKENQKRPAKFDKQRSTSESQLTQEPFTLQAKKVPEVSKTQQCALHLETIASLESIGSLDSIQLANILHNHNINPNKYKTHTEMMYAVQCLWQAIHATDAIGGTASGLSKSVRAKTLEKKTAMQMHEVPKSPNIKIKKSFSISNITSVAELERLTEDEMRDILRIYSIDTGHYTEKHELYYGVLLLWNSKKAAAKEAQKNPYSTPVRSEDQKTHYVAKWLLKNDSIAIKHAKEVRHPEKKQEPVPHTSNREPVQNVVDNSAAIQQLVKQKGEATKYVIGSIPVMGTQLDMKRKQENTIKMVDTVPQTIRHHETGTIYKTSSEKSKTEAAVSKDNEHRYASVDILKKKPQTINNSATEIIYTDIETGYRNQAYDGPKKVTAKMERRPEVVYAQLATSPRYFVTGDTSSIMSFGDRIAPESTELEFAYIDDTLSEMSVNQGTRNGHKTSSTSSYYSKLLDGGHPK